MKIILDTPIERKAITHKEASFFTLNIKNKEGTVRFNYETDEGEFVKSFEARLDFSVLTENETTDLERLLTRLVSGSDDNAAFLRNEATIIPR